MIRLRSPTNRGSEYLEGRTLAASPLNDLIQRRTAVPKLSRGRHVDLRGTRLEDLDLEASYDGRSPYGTGAITSWQ